MLGPASPAAAAALARRSGTSFRARSASVPEIDVFAAAWGVTHDVAADVRFEQGIYALERLREPRRVPGAPRRATEADRELLGCGCSTSARGAARERAGRGPDRADAPPAARRRRPSFLIWEDGEPVSLAGSGGNTPTGSRIGPVYTPPEHRGRGYGSALTAAITRARLDAGRRFCFLYTDLANPTSNKIYVDLGYERVGDSLQYVFAYG